MPRFPPLPAASRRFPPPPAASRYLPPLSAAPLLWLGMGQMASKAALKVLSIRDSTYHHAFGHVPALQTCISSHSSHTSLFAPPAYSAP
ncbi:hypothetical protein DFH06DRAFT_1327302 [Mycena polygramma]|nr:hypothetical protein DFH06DRAFT_1327302 [Mycena polygramma]